MVACGYDPGTQDVKTRGSGCKVILSYKFEVSLGYRRP